MTATLIANESGVPESTVRRYLSTFDDFFLCKKIGRASKYDPVSVPLIKKINALYGEGYSTTEIRQQLSNEEPYTPGVVGDGGSVVASADNLPQPLMNQVAVMVESMVDQKTKALQLKVDKLELAQSQMAADKESLQEIIDQYDAEQKIALNELSKRISERDAHLVETMRLMMDNHQATSKPWWKRLL
jgi:hypothetical protein